MLLASFLLKRIPFRKKVVENEHPSLFPGATLEFVQCTVSLSSGDFND